jgi:hypothetical protein
MQLHTGLNHTLVPVDILRAWCREINVDLAEGRVDFA